MAFYHYKSESKEMKFWFDEKKIDLEKFIDLLENNPLSKLRRYLHRLDGPAFILQNISSEIAPMASTAYYIKGIHFLDFRYREAVDFYKEHGEIKFLINYSQ